MLLVFLFCLWYYVVISLDKICFTTLLEKIHSSFPEIQSLICEDIYFVSFDKKENEVDKKVKQNLLTILKAIAYEDVEEKNKFKLVIKIPFGVSTIND